MMSGEHGNEYDCPQCGQDLRLGAEAYDDMAELERENERLLEQYSTARDHALELEGYKTDAITLKRQLDEAQDVDRLAARLKDRGGIHNLGSIRVCRHLANWLAAG